MTRQPIGLHAPTHLPDGQDPLPFTVIYIDERVLDASADTVLFDAFPDNLHILELQWAAFTESGDGDDAMIYLDFNGDTLSSAAEDYRWHLSIADRDGSQTSTTDSALLRTGGGIGYVAHGIFGWGRVWFPAYNVDFQNDDAEGVGPLYHGTGGWRDGGGGQTDSWTVAGSRDNGAILASILVQVAKVSDDSLMTFGAGSRFTLTGY